MGLLESSPRFLLNGSATIPQPPVRSVSVSDSIAFTDEVIIISGGTVTLTLPPISSITKAIMAVTIKAEGGNAIVAASGTDVIEEVMSSPAAYGATSNVTMPQCVVFMADKATNKWLIVS